jgi:hypothetical protein
MTSLPDTPSHAAMPDPADDFATLHDRIAGLRARRIFFIGGMPKSGTTWLQLLLNAHPDIDCRGEGHFCNFLEPLLQDAFKRHNAHIEVKNNGAFRDLGGYATFSPRHIDYLMSAAIALLMAERAGAAPIVGEKTPDNVVVFPRLHALFPAARLVLVLRDGRDCTVSGWYHNLRLNEPVMRSRFPEFIDYVGAYAKTWSQTVENGLRFAAAHPQTCAVIRYEELVQDPAPALARLLAFLGAATDAAIVQGCIEAADFTALSGGRKPGQEDRSSLFRLGVTGDWVRHFDAAARAVFEAAAGAQLRRCGYGDGPLD